MNFQVKEKAKEDILQNEFKLPEKTLKKPKIPSESQTSSIWKKFKETGKSSKLPASGFIRKKATKISSPQDTSPTSPIESKLKQKVSDNNKQKGFIVADDKKGSIDKFNKTRHGSNKITSLFRNNPDIPNVPHRAVKPVTETVFSNLEFKDLEIHSYMVCFHFFYNKFFFPTLYLFFSF